MTEYLVKPRGAPPLPFDWLSRSARRRVLAVSALLTLGMLAVLASINTRLQTGQAPAGIISFALARSLPRAQTILGSWDTRRQLLAAISLGIDYLFLVTYACTLSLGCSHLAARLQTPAPVRAAVGILLAWGQLAAALFDGLENYGLIQLLLGSHQPWWPEMAWFAAILKFGIIALALLYLAAGWLAEAIAWLLRRFEKG